MIDYLLVYPSAEARTGAYPIPDGNPPCWEIEDGLAMPVTVKVADAVEDGETLISPPIFAPGFWMAIRCAERMQAIEDLPECELCTDAGLAAAGEKYVHFCRLEPETILGQVSPTFAGDEYHIPVGQPASALDEWLIDSES